MSPALTAGLALLIAFVLQSGLSLIGPGAARVIDPLLIVAVITALARGEVWGMCAGAVAGWVLDAHFGGVVLGLAGLSRMLVGFLVGFASARLLLLGPGSRLAVLAAATVLDARGLEWLAASFGVEVPTLGALPLGLRALFNAVLGALLYGALERRLRVEVGA